MEKQWNSDFDEGLEEALHFPHGSQTFVLLSELLASQVLRFSCPWLLQGVLIDHFRFLVAEKIVKFK